MEKEYDIEFVVPAPKIGTGKHKAKYATVNYLPLWYRWSVTRIKNKFKEDIREWYLEPHNATPHYSADIHYRILRNNYIKIDGDAFVLVYKWLQDLLVELKYIKDDDHCRVVLEPTNFGVKGVETSIKVQIKFIKEEPNENTRSG